MMLRASSEMAVAIMVGSLPEKPIWVARSRPFCRAAMMSPTWLMGKSASSSGIVNILAHPRRHQFQTFFKIKSRGDAIERQPKLHHRKGDVGLNPHDHHFCAAQFGSLSDATKSSRGKGIHHIKSADVDHDAARTKLTYLVSQLVLQLDQILIGRCRLHACDQNTTLL